MVASLLTALVMQREYIVPFTLIIALSCIFSVYWLLRVDFGAMTPIEFIVMNLDSVLFSIIAIGVGVGIGNNYLTRRKL